MKVKEKHPINIIKHTKRYVLRFYTWWYEYSDETKSSNYKNHSHITDEEFDTIEEVKEIMALYEELYKNTPRPFKIGAKPRYGSDNRIIEFQNGEAKYWGYILIDFEEKKIVNVYHDKLSGWENWKTNLNLHDMLFREEGEIPEDYEFDEGEWQGWLQFRWGNGLNAIEKEDEINRKKAERAKIEKERKAKEKAEYEEMLKEYEEAEQRLLDDLDDEEDY